MYGEIWDTSELILHVRWESDLTQAEFGIRLAEITQRDRPYSRSTVARWESAEEIPNLTIPFLYALAVIGKTSLEDLCGKLGYLDLFPRKIS